MSEELIKELKRRIAQLEDEVTGFKGEAKDRRLKGGEQKAQFEKLKKEHLDLTTDRDTWKAKAEAAPGDLQARVDELQGKLRSVTHKTAFREAAGKSGVVPKALEAAWKLSGYEPAGDEADPAAIEAALTRAKEDHPYLFEAPADEPADEPARAGAPQAGAAPGGGGGRGGDAVPGLYRVRQADMADAAFMEKNSAKIAEHRKAGTLAFVD